RAIFNILEDFNAEKTRLEDAQRAVLNILEDFTAEKERLEDAQRAVLNILDDFSAEKGRLEDTQRAVLNILEDFDVERTRTEAANRELREAFDSLRRAKEAADVANREVEAFSYSVSHDLRAPLRAIDGFSQALLEDYEHVLDETGRDYLRRVRTATQRMAQLIDDLLKLSRLTRAELNITMVDLSAIARGVAHELQRTQPERKVTFRIADGLTASADAHLIKIVLDNLLGNSWKFTSRKEAALIEFFSIPENGSTAYCVRDNGAGFDMAYSSKLFATFQRLHSEKDFSGTGIGLSLVQRVIHRLGGEIRAEGKVGEGAMFCFTLDAGGRETAR
ncbi:MAG TPA: ATP-binding protein, partial [Verrucomicrobiae bacterium]|nr:ATP-binding protein [Verrucomicrobiae bacterium]